jgi:hypothetical protein
MAVVMSMQWDGVTPEQYEEARQKVAWETDVPDGAKLHVTWFTEEQLRVTDVWETGEDFQRFVNDRLNPAVEEIGIQGGPSVDIKPRHAVFAPAVDEVAG